MDILEEIIANKKKEIAKFKPLSSIDRFEQKGFFWQFSNRSLAQSLLTSPTGIIAEFKRKSPSKGWFQPKELEIEKVIRHYNDFGAAGISVLTDEHYFGGNLDDLIQAKIISDLPILRKDFIVDKWQIAESKAFGADVILLIAACLTHDEVKEFACYAKSIELETILEIHNEAELDKYCDDVTMIGINNRNLKTFEVSIDISLQLINKLPIKKPAIAESGISNIAAINTLKNAGYKGFLIGENFMKTDNPGEAFKEFTSSIKN